MNDPGLEGIGYGLIITIVFIIGGYIAFVFYILTLQKILKQLDSRNVFIQPSKLWLLLIPYFSLGYHFIVVFKMAKSIMREQDFRGIAIIEKGPGFFIGIGMCVAFCFCAIPVPFLIPFFLMAAIPAWIIYWVKMNQLKKELSNPSYSNVQDAEVIDVEIIE